jgi:hypothetical protein
MLRAVAESWAHEVVVKKQSQTKCPRCGAWSAADRCHSVEHTGWEIGVDPMEEMQGLER